MKLFLIPALALALTGCGDEKPENIFEPVDIDLSAIKTPEEDAALTVIRLGYDRWVVACAYSMAKDGKTIDEALEQCPAKFDLDKEDAA